MVVLMGFDFVQFVAPRTIRDLAWITLVQIIHTRIKDGFVAYCPPGSSKFCDNTVTIMHFCPLV